MVTQHQFQIRIILNFGNIFMWIFKIFPRISLCLKISVTKYLKTLQWPKIETLLCIPYVPAPLISVHVLKFAFDHSVTWNICDFAGKDRWTYKLVPFILCDQFVWTTHMCSYEIFVFWDFSQMFHGAVWLVVYLG